MNELKIYLKLMGLVVVGGLLLSLTMQLTAGLFYKPTIKVIHYLCVEREDSDFECRDAIDEELINEATQRVRNHLSEGGE